MSQPTDAYHPDQAGHDLSGARDIAPIGQIRAPFHDLDISGQIDRSLIYVIGMIYV